MLDVVAIVPREQGFGFTLSGVRVREAATQPAALETLEEELSTGRTGIILIDETYLTGLPKRLQRRVDESTVPLVVGIPVISKWGYVTDHNDRFERIVHRAIGYRIKLFGDD